MDIDLGVASAGVLDVVGRKNGQGGDDHGGHRDCMAMGSRYVSLRFFRFPDKSDQRECSSSHSYAIRGGAWSISGDTTLHIDLWRGLPVE